MCPVLWQRAGTRKRIHYVSQCTSQGRGYRCNSSTVHHSSFTRHRGSPTLTVSRTMLASVPCACLGSHEGSANISGHLRVYAVRERHTRSSAGLSGWRLWIARAASCRALESTTSGTRACRAGCFLAGSMTDSAGSFLFELDRNRLLAACGPPAVSGGKARVP